ncbi:putative transcriptional regulator [Archaeoglobus sulfaticallidus PM70-1]|uniref:Putative transcriptional regulator n=1 Tax=Archaeoglobus sulfaticallidus PM70-1 TaxID=387631 RepID=N0BIL4_9EURY|nr:winged helix-turn-helix transcriptional regulator [Archaeoglobus sulfaticallidus]AGK60311.1 putative transcriptional regulator [Archaeoglobus sulfaticallidus PM70-1]
MNVLLSRKDAMRLLIISELVLRKETNQRDIARKFNLTPQAISEHFKELVDEGYIRVIHKGFYEVTEKGTEWLTKNLFDLHIFSEELIKKLYSKSIVAIASGDIKEDDRISYWYQDGFIYAKKNKTGNGIALTSASDGEDVLIKPLEGFEPPKKGEIIVVKVPDIGEGGSRKINYGEFSKLIKDNPKKIVVAIGVEALVACRKIRVEPIFFGSKEVCIEASHHGAGVIAVCTESLLDNLLVSLVDEGLNFKIVSFNLNA